MTNGIATGFLVAPFAILTCAHIFDDLSKNETIEDLYIIFDYLVS